MNYTVEIVLAHPPRRELSPNHRSDLRHFLSWTVGPSLAINEACKLAGTATVGDGIAPTGRYERLFRRPPAPSPRVC
jgi:hypothetical protein